MALRFVHLADTHLGARHPERGPGDPYVDNYRRALGPALRGEVDLVVHAGDIYNRSRPPTRVVAEACGGLLDAADAGAHVILLAGNHERSVIPGRLLLGHPRVHVVDEPGRIGVSVDGCDAAFYGFPFIRNDVRGRFDGILGQTGWPRGRAAVNVLLCHQALDGATVGPVDYTFRSGPDVIPRAWLPADLDHVMLGHIHRRQDLVHPLREELLLSYPGATERTSRAERLEEKGYLLGEFEPGRPVNQRFVVMPSVPITHARRRA
jgi:DNA repair protein SbcD/Mre11